MTDQLLDFELRLLIIRYGRRKVLSALAALGDQSLTDLEAQLLALEKIGKVKTRREPKSAQELVATACEGHPELRNLILDIVNRYQSRTFLPQLRDVERFLDHRGVQHGYLKSRTTALRHVIQGLSGLSEGELSRLLEDTSPQGQSDFSLLANQIMGKEKGETKE